MCEPTRKNLYLHFSYIFNLKLKLQKIIFFALKKKLKSCFSQQMALLFVV